MLKYVMKDKNGNFVSVSEDKLDIWLQSQNNSKDDTKTSKEIIGNNNCANEEISDDKLISGRDYVELNKETMFSLNIDDCMFFKFAGTGAMGEEAGIFIMMKDKTLYHTNYLFTEITKDDLAKAFPFIANMQVGFWGHVSGLDDNFQYIDLGLGNGLLVRNEVYDEFGPVIKKLSYGDRYNKWITIARGVLKNR